MPPALVGREAELRELRDGLDAAWAGRPQVVLCRGEPGIGKTRLAEELSDLARERGAAVAWGSSGEAAGAPPYWPWIQVLRSLTGDAAPPAPDAVLAGEPYGDGAQERFRRFDAVARLLRGSTLERPLVLVLDDLHWADHPSVLLVRHLARTLSTERLLVLATARSTASGHGPELVALLRERATRHVELTGLPVLAVAEQLTAITGRPVDTAEAGRVHALTGGNPFFVAEVGRVLPARWTSGGTAPVTSTVRGAIAARLARLSPACVELVRAASVTGRDFSVPSVVAAMVDRSPGDCLEALDEAREAGLIEDREVPGEHRFVHALVRDAVESGLASAERVRLHRRAAGVLERLGEGPAGPHLFDLARHWAVAALQGEQPRAVGWIERAAEEAVRGTAHEEGARLFRLALSVGRGHLMRDAECRLTLGLARALHRSGDDAASLDSRLAAAALARGLGRADLLAEAALAAEAIGPTPTEGLTQRLCREALAALPADDLALRARVGARFAEACVYAAWAREDGLDDHETAGRASAEALVLAEGCGDPGALRAALRARRLACSSPEGLDERSRLADRMLALGRDAADPRTQMWARLWRVDVAFGRGDLATVARETESLSSCVEQVGGPHARFELLRCRAVLAQAQARFPDALRLAEEAFEEIGPTGFGYQERAGLLHQIGLHIGHEATGSVDAAGFTDTTVFDRPPQTAGVIVAVANAHMLASVGRLDEARAVHRSLGPPAAWRPSPHAVLPALAFGVNLAIALGADDDVRTLRDRLDRYRGHHVVSGAGQVAYFGPVELWLGRAGLHLGLLDEAVGDLDEAGRACTANGAAGYRVESRHLLAAALAGRAGPGDVPRARALLDATVREAAALGMGPVRALAAQLLDRVVAAGPLTRREWEVAELVAQGSTNRMIAARLRVSERTAQNHVQHILTKLDLANRSQITAWVTRRDAGRSGVSTRS